MDHSVVKLTEDFVVSLTMCCKSNSILQWHISSSSLNDHKTIFKNSNLPSQTVEKGWCILWMLLYPKILTM